MAPGWVSVKFKDFALLSLLGINFTANRDPKARRTLKGRDLNENLVQGRGSEISFRLVLGGRAPQEVSGRELSRF